MKKAIILLTYPNTEEKLNLLKKNINILSNTGLPIFVFANMQISSYYFEGANFIYAGDNTMYSASDFLDDSIIAEARRKCKYRSYLQFDNYTINYFPISYGHGKSYYWACIKLYQVAFKHLLEKGYDYFMLSQYDTVLGDSSLNKIENYFQELETNKLDGDFAVDAHMGENHLNGDIFFGKVEWWYNLFDKMTPEDFYKISYPNWTPEEYYFLKAKEQMGRVKIRIKKTENSSLFYNNLPPSWIKQEQESIGNLPVNLYFEDILGNGLSNHTNTSNFDVNKAITVSVLPKENYHELFVYNQINSPNPKKVRVNIDFKNKFTDSLIRNVNLDLQPGYWHLVNIYEDILGHKIEITTEYLEINKNVYII